MELRKAICSLLYCFLVYCPKAYVSHGVYIGSHNTTLIPVRREGLNHHQIPIQAMAHAIGTNIVVLYSKYGYHIKHLKCTSKRYNISNSPRMFLFIGSIIEIVMILSIVVVFIFSFLYLYVHIFMHTHVYIYICMCVDYP